MALLPFGSVDVAATGVVAVDYLTSLKECVDRPDIHITKGKGVYDSCLDIADIEIRQTTQHRNKSEERPFLKSFDVFHAINPFFNKEIISQSAAL